MSKYSQHVSTSATPQTEKIFGKNQVLNNSGGYVFQIDRWSQLNRFLILGSEGNTYYASEHKMAVDNAKNVIECIKFDGVRTVDTIVKISQDGRAPKNDPAIFALALVTKYGNDEARKSAYKNLSRVCRISTHLFQFLSTLESIGKGTGMGLRKAIQRWYNEKDLDSLSLQVIKYRNREGFEHRDALRLAHVRTSDDTRNEIYKWIAWSKYKNGKDTPVSSKNPIDGIKYLSKHEQISAWIKSHYSDNVLISTVHPLINAFEQAQRAKSASEIVSLINEYKLPREAIPTVLLNTIEVWDALLPHMPMTAMIRNLGTMSKIGLLKPLSAASKLVCEKICNEEAIKKAHVHPIQILSALKVYGQGHGMRSDAIWDIVPTIVDALDSAFYTTFKNVEKTGKRFMLALDVSSSMNSGEISGIPGLTPRDASGAMAMVTAKVEEQVMVCGFSDKFIELPISGKQRLDDVIKVIDNLPFSSTDCSLPMVEAKNRKLEVDAFVVYTDNETFAGKIHPVQALHKYRKSSGIQAKEIVVGMTATEFSIADPNDGGMMDVVGFDASAPEIISDFINS